MVGINNCLGSSDFALFIPIHQIVIILPLFVLLPWIQIVYSSGFVGNDDHGVGSVCAAKWLGGCIILSLSLKRTILLLLLRGP